MVYLIGAGCGDKKLITVKGKESIERADVIIYDYLANPELLEDAKQGAELIYVGKMAGNHTMSQEQINQLIVEKAIANKIVVRLKGGDPYVFGRGGEEGETLFKEGINFEVVPGISSSIGGLAYAGIPITHRGIATSFHVITGNRKQGSESLDFSTYAKLKGTLVFLMGIGNLETIATGLMQNGMDKNMPVAIIEKASSPQQRTTIATLETITQLAKENNVKPPGLLVVGEVINKRKSLNWFENKPLFSKNIIVTRSRKQSSEVARKISALGGNVLSMPMIDIKPINQQKLAEAVEKLSTYTYAIFTSTNAVDIFFDALENSGKDSRALYDCKIVAVGTATESKLKQHGIKADYVPQRFVSEAVVELLSDKLKSDDHVLIPCAKIASPALTEALAKICTVTDVRIYDTIKVETNYEKEIKAIKDETIDYITFASSSTVENFVHCIGKDNLPYANRAKLISIGPKTTQKMLELGLTLYKQAEQYTIDGIIGVIKNDK